MRLSKITTVCKVAFVVQLVFFQNVYASEIKNEIRPNILWITIEDTSPQFLGCYGDTSAQTPVIDKLASEGIRFTNAFSTSTICSPSRTAIITGVKTYKTGTGNHRSKFPIPEYIKGFPYYLRHVGYYTSNNKKTDYNVANETDFINEAWHESSDQAGWWNRKPGQPFFSVFNFLDSHQSRTMTMPYNWYEEHVLTELGEDQIIADSEFDMPPLYRESPKMRTQFARVYNSLKLVDKKIGELIHHLKEDHLMDSTIIFFFADHGEAIPRGKSNGINLGYRVPFIIWIPEKFKDLSPWGNGGVITEELIDFSDLAPTIISIAGGEIPDYLEGRPFLGEKRKSPIEHVFLSSDRCNNGIDIVRSVTDGKYLYSRNFMPFMPEIKYWRYNEIAEITQLMRTDFAEDKLNPLQKSLFESRPAEFLFDIESDLWETKNLVDDPDYRSILENMRRKLKNEIIQSRDVMFLPEYEIGLLSESSTAYEYRLSENNYPIEKIYEVASISGCKGNDILQKQLKWLKSPNKIIRYWAAMGLKNQSSNDLNNYSDEIFAVINDPYPPVAVIASTIAYDVFGNKLAEANLKKFCTSPNIHISLMTMNFLLYVKEKQAFIDTVSELHKHLTKSKKYYSELISNDSIRDFRAEADMLYFLRNSCMDFLGILKIVPNTFEYRD